MFPVLIYDKAMQKLAEIDDYEYLLWRRRWRLPDVWQIQINRHKANAEYLQDENLVLFQRNGKMRVGLIGYRQLELTSAGAGGENWQIGGFSFDGVFEQRLALHNVSSGTGYDEQRGNAEDVMKHYVRANCTEGDLWQPGVDDPDRIVPGLVIAPVQYRGGTVNYRARFQTLSELLEDLSIYTGLGYEVTVDIENGGFVFEVREGINRTVAQTVVPPVIFSPEFGNVKRFNYRHSKLDSKNVAIVAGQGEAADRAIVPLLAHGSTRLEYDALDDWDNPVSSDGLFQMIEEGLIIDPMNNPYGWPFATDFSLDTAGQTPGDIQEWGVQFSNNSYWQANAESAALGGNVLRHYHTGAVEGGFDIYSKAAIWVPEDMPDQDPYYLDDVEVLVKAKAGVMPGTTKGLVGSVITNAYIQTEWPSLDWVPVFFYTRHHFVGDECFFSVILISDIFRNEKLTECGTVKFNAQAGDWCWLKLRIVGPVDNINIRAKVWKDDFMEPESWMIDESGDFSDYFPWDVKWGYIGFTATEGYAYDERFDDYDYIEARALVPLHEAYFWGQEVDLAPYGYARTNNISWDAVIPEQTEVKISVRIQTGGVWGEWQLAENGGGIPGINAGDNLAGKKLQVRVYMAAWAIETTPILKRVNLVLNGRQTEVGYTGHDRREMFVDARDLDTSEQLAQRGGERLAGAGEEVVLEIENLPGKKVEYETLEPVEFKRQEETQEDFQTGTLVGVIAKPTGSLELDYRED